VPEEAEEESEENSHGKEADVAVGGGVDEAVAYGEVEVHEQAADEQQHVEEEEEVNIAVEGCASWMKEE